MSIDLDHPFLPLLTQRTSTSREFLRELHRGLETGTKRGIESIKGILGETEEVINAKGQIIRKPLIKEMSPQGFHKMIKRLWVLAEKQGDLISVLNILIWDIPGQDSSIRDRPA